MTAALSSLAPGSSTSAPTSAPGRPVPGTGGVSDGRVLVLVDDPLVRRALDDALRAEGLSVRATTDPASADVLVRSYRPDVLIVDARHLSTPLARDAAADAHVRLVVNGADTQTRVAAIRDGADDAVSPDCSPMELAVRCTALLQRPAARRASGPDRQLCVGRVTVDLGRRTITVDGREVAATRIEFDLFTELCRQPAEVCTRAQLLESVWGPRWVGDPHVVDVHLSNLRRKVREHAPDLQLLRTVRGVGFRLSDDMLPTQA